MTRYERLKQKAKEETEARVAQPKQEAQFFPGRYDRLRVKYLEDRNTEVAGRLNQFLKKADSGSYMTQKELDQYQADALAYIKSGSSLRDTMKKLGYEDPAEDDRWQSTMADISTSVGKYFDLYGEYETEDSWNAAQQKIKDYTDSLSFDVEAGKMELSGLREQIAAAEKSSAIPAHPALAFSSKHGAATLPEDKLQAANQLQDLRKRADDLEKYIQQSEHNQNVKSMEDMARAIDGFSTKSKYDPSKYKGGDQYQTDPYALYAAINGNEDAAAEIYNQAMTSGGSTPEGYNALGAIIGSLTEGKTELKELTPYEVAIFNALESEYGLDKAEEYYYLIQGDLYARDRQRKMEENIKYAQEHPRLASLSTVALAPLKGISYLGQVTDYLGDGKIDENAPYNVFSYSSSDIRGERGKQISEKWANALGEGWGKVGNFGYQLGMSMGDFLMTAAVTGGNEAMSLSIMGAGAAADTTIAAKQRGLDDGQALALGTIAGAAEAVSEKIGWDALFDAALLGKSTLKFMLKNALSEGFEEPTSSVINTIADLIISGDKAELRKAVQDYVNNGEDLNKAWGKAFGDYALSLGADALGGLLSGVGMGGGAVAINNAPAMALSAIDKAEHNRYVKNLGSDILKGENLEGLTQISQEIGGEAVESASKKATKKASKKNVGRLAEAVSGQIETKSKADLTAKLVANGVEQKTAETLSGIVNNVWQGRDTSTESRQLLEAAAKDPKINKAVESVYSEIAPMVKRMEAISSGKPVTSSTAGQVQSSTGKTSSSSLQPIGQENQPTAFAENVQDVADGTFVKSTGAAVDTVEIASVGKNATVTVNGTETVSLSDVSWENEATAYHYTAVAEDDSMTPAAANRILSNPKSSSTAFISEALRAFHGGVRNDARVLGNLNGAVISAEEADSIFQDGRDAAQTVAESKAAAVKEKQKAVTEEVSTTAKKGGVFYGYDGLTIDQRNDGRHKAPTKKQSVGIRFAKKMAGKFGSTIYFYESYEDESGNRVYKDRHGNIAAAKKGFYDPKDGSIHIDLNGDNILFTISHELVHFIRDWSPVKFQLMADLVMEGFNRQGLTAEELIEAKQADYAKDGIQLTEEEAFEEVIAAALEGIMADGRVMELMQKIEAKDKGLAAKVKQFFQDIAELIRSTVYAYQDAVPDSPEGRLIRKLEDIYSQLQEAFAEGVMDAGTNFQNAENTTMEGGVRYKLANIKDVTPSNDRLKRNKISVAYMKSVFDVSADKLIPGETSIKDQYKKYWSEWGENISTERFGDIAVKNSSMRSEMRHGSTPVKVASIAAIPSVIKYGEIVDWFEKNTGLFRITVAAPIRIGEKPYIMGVMLQRDDQNQRLYIHDVEIDEEASVLTQEHLDSTGPYDSNNDLFLSTVLHEIVEVKTKIQKNNDRAIKHFGKTYKWAETGYLLADGSKLDFSGRHEGASGGYRTVDHRDILDIYPEDTELDGNGAMVDFMSQGNIRIMPEGDGINLQVQPTKAQERALDDFISRVRGEVTLDIDDSNGNTVVSVEYPRGTRSSKVLQDIRNYFTDGTEPVISGLTQFRYSIGSKTDSAMQKLLEKENESLREDVARLKELLKLQGKQTHGTVFTPSSVEAAARYLKKNAGAKGDTKALTKLLSGFYSYIASGEVSWEEVREKARPIANWLMDHVEHGRSDYAQEVLDQIHGSRVYLDESQTTEAAYRFESYDAFRRSMAGAITISRNADMSLDVWWQEMSTLYPDIFSADITASDMPGELFNIVNRLRNENTSALEYEHNRRWIEQDLIREVYDSYWRVSNLRTVADRNAAQVNKLKEQHMQKISRLKTDSRQKVEQLKEQHKAEVEAVRNAYRYRIETQRKEMTAKYQESRKKAVEGRRATELRNKIRRLKQDLQSTMLHPTDGKYIPGGLFDAMVEVCNLIDTDTDLYKKDGSVNKAQLLRDQTKVRLEKLSAEYNALEKHPDGAYQGEFDEYISKYLEDIRSNFSGKSLMEMNTYELGEFYDILKSIKDTIADARQLIGLKESVSIYEVADATDDEQKRIRVNRRNGERSWLGEANDNRMLNILSPMRNVERMSGYNQNSAFFGLFRELEAGMRKKSFFKMNAYKMFEDLSSGKNYEDAIYKPFGNEYTDKEGRKFRVSKMQMMQAILSYEREQSNFNMRHVDTGGFSFADLSLLEKGNVQKAVSKEHSHDVPAAGWMVAEFNEALKNDAWAQTYMETARKFFNGMAKNAINETTMLVKHRIVAKGSAYIPFTVDRTNVVREVSEMDQVVQKTINQYGMLQEIKENAQQALIITGLNNIIDQHIDQVGTVYGLAVPVRNFNKVWNTKANGATGEMVKGIIEKTWGTNGVSHIEQTVKDVQGPRKSNKNPIYSKIRSNYINSTFLLNGSVVSKQIGSLFAANSALDRMRNPLAMLGNLLYTGVRYKEISAKVDKYSATAWMRRQGLSDAEIATLLTERRKGWIAKWVGKISDWTGITKAITAMDSAVALSLWKYCEQDVKARTGLAGEALMQATAEHFDNVVETTQSMSDELHRPEFQKTDDMVKSTFAMFKTDLFQMVGNLNVAAGRAFANPTSANKKALARVVTSVAFSALWAQMITLLFAAIRYKPDRYRDENGDITWKSASARILFDLAAELAGYFAPLIGGEVVEAAISLKTGRADDLYSDMTFSAVNDLWSTTYNLLNKAIDDEKKVTFEDYKKLSGKALSLLGFPANNVLRLWDAIAKHVKDAANGEFLSFEAGAERSDKQYTGKILDAYGQEGKQAAAVIFEDALDEIAFRKAKGEEVTDDHKKEAKSALKTEIGKMYRKDDIERSTVEKIMRQVFKEDPDDTFWSIDRWDYMAAHKTSDGYSKYAKLISAVKTGNRLDSVVSWYTSHGVDPEDLASEITKEFKKSYLNLSGEKKAQMREMLVDGYVACGVRRLDAIERIGRWKEKEEED